VILKTNGEFYVAFSGGKDSTVLMDLAARVCSAMDKPLNCIYVDTGLEYPEVKSNVKTVIEYIQDKYGIGINLDVLHPKMNFKAVIEKYGWVFPSKAVATKIYNARRGSIHAKRLFDGLNGKLGGGGRIRQNIRPVETPVGH
jgi:3'-phosphoadenosine 5'-phosphosulfate sulfotransferase (PAPS reductase)/FAD synthetase